MRFPPLEELLPHGAPMLWLDAVVAWDAGLARVRCTLTVRREQVFLEAACAEPLVALEWMAQTAAALLALQAREAGDAAVRAHLLGGVADANFAVDGFRVGDVLTISAEQRADGWFDCSVERASVELVRARLRLAERAHVQARDPASQHDG